LKNYRQVGYDLPMNFISSRFPPECIMFFSWPSAKQSAPNAAMRCDGLFAEEEVSLNILVYERKRGFAT